MNSREIFQRIRSQSWLKSQALEVVLRTWNTVSPGEFARLYRLVRPYTMSSNARLRGLYSSIQQISISQTPGDVVECGAARGGSAALMGLTLSILGAARTLWVYDTFEGLPPPTLDDPDFETAMVYTGKCRGELDEVVSLFEQLGILPNSRFVKGLFRETLPVCPVEKIAVLHLDGDWYDSVRVCLDQLYERVSPGGIIQFDDYGHWARARQAVDEFLRKRDIDVPLTRLDYTGRQMIKPLAIGYEINSRSKGSNQIESS